MHSLYGSCHQRYKLSKYGQRSQNTLEPISMRIAPCEMLDLYLRIERNLFLSSGQPPPPPADMRNSAVCS